MDLACPHCGTKNRIPEARIADQPNCGKCKQPLFAGKPVVLDEAGFDAMAASGLPVLVDFWADWCGPCRVMAPHFEAAAKELAGQAVLAKVDTEANPGLSTRFAVRSIPTLLLVRDGKVLARDAGARPASEIVRMVRQGALG